MAQDLCSHCPWNAKESCRQGFDDLLGCVEVGVAQDAEQTLVAKLTQFGVFGLVKSVAMW